MSKWTRFMDMHSGGDAKTKFDKWYIEAPLEQAKVIFYNLSGRNPDQVTCTCCGDDYSYSESNSLHQATAYDRGCAYSAKLHRYLNRPAKKSTWPKPYETLEDYLKRPDIKVVYAKDIKPAHRIGTIPQSGYVWVG